MKISLSDHVENCSHAKGELVSSIRKRYHDVIYVTFAC